MSYFYKYYFFNLFVNFFNKKKKFYNSNLNLNLKKKQYYFFLSLNYLIENYTYLDFFSFDLIIQFKEFLSQNSKKINFNKLYSSTKVNFIDLPKLPMFSVNIHELFELTFSNTISIFKKRLITKELIFIIYLKYFKNIINNLNNNNNWNILKLPIIKTSLKSKLIINNQLKKKIFFFLFEKFFTTNELSNSTLPIYLLFFRNNLIKSFLNIKIFLLIKNEILINIIFYNWRV
jgi:hypothetical protein